MGELKKHQPPMTIEEQIKNLKNIGLNIDDEDYAKDILNNISYFRLIKAYSLNLKYRNGNYYKDIKFKNIVDLYFFNSELRHIIFPEIERIEIMMRCRIANYFSQNYGVLGYLDSKNFYKEEYHRAFLIDIEDEISRNSRSPFVSNFIKNYEDAHLPIYALTEVMSFGALSKFYKNMHSADKKAIAKTFGIGYTYLESWLESISYVRNICAHYGRLYNANLTKKPVLYKQYSSLNIKNDKIYGVILCMKHILNNDVKWIQFVDKLDLIIEKYENANISTMGFPDNWKNILLE